MDRTQFIGSSDAAAVLGVSPWSTPLDVYLEKIGQAPPTVETEPMRWGKLLEPLVLDEFTRVTGMPTQIRQKVFVHATNQFMTCTVDAVTEDDDGCPTVVEAKTSGFSDGFGADDDAIPDHYIAQVQHQLMVTGYRMAFVPVLFHGNRFRVYKVARDDVLVTLLHAIELDFWDCVQSRTPPPWGRKSPGSLAQLNPECSGEVASDTIHLDVAAYEAAVADVKAAERRAERHKGSILAAMGTAEFAHLPDGRRVKRYLQYVAGGERTVTTTGHTRHYFRIIGGVS